MFMVQNNQVFFYWAEVADSGREKGVPHSDHETQVSHEACLTNVLSPFSS